MDLALVLIVFVVLFAVVLIAVSGGFRYVEAERKKKVGEVLGAADSESKAAQTTILDQGQKPAQPLLRGLRDLPIYSRLQKTITQADLTWSVEKLLVMMAVCAVVGSMTGLRIRVPIVREFTSLFFACIAGSLPYLYVWNRRRKRLQAFEEQFPEALDFLARSMRAGHAFSVSLEMLADETPDPLGREFRQVFNEQNLGSPLDVALRNLKDRIPLLDVSFFVSAVLLQRETGGNLAEILTKLAYIIRERFRVKGQVRAASAHGRMTAGILTLLPIVTFLGMTITWPGYVESMTQYKEGRWLIVFIFVGQALGYYCIRRIVNIKV